MPMARPGTVNSCIARLASRSISAVEGAAAERELASGAAKALRTPLAITAARIRSIVRIIGFLSDRKGLQQALDDGPDAAEQGVATGQAGLSGKLLQHARPILGFDLR